MGIIKKIVDNLFWFILSALLVALCIFFYDVYTQPENVLYQNDKWEITYEDGTTVSDVNLTTYRIDHYLREGEVVRITNIIPKIPDEYAVDYMILSENAIVRVYVDGKALYQYGQELYDSKEMVGSGYHILRIDKEDELKPIEIEYQATFDLAFSYFEAPQIHEEGKAIQDFANENILLVLMVLFLGIFGIMIMIIGLLRYKNEKELFSLIPFGIYVTTVGLWLLGKTYVINIFSLNYSLNTTMELISRNIAPLPIIVLIFVLLNGLPAVTPWKYKAAVAGTVGIVLEIVSLGLLHIFKIADLARTGMIFEISVVLGAFIIFILCFEIKKSAEINKTLIMVAGIAVLALSKPIMFVVGWINRVVSIGKPFVINYLFAIVMMVVITAFMTYYFILLHQEAKRKARNKLGGDIEHIDLVSGYYNRAFCLETMRKHFDNKEFFEAILIRIPCLGEIFLSKGGKTAREAINYITDAIERCFKEDYMHFRFCTDDFVLLSTKKRGVDKKALALLLNNLKEVSAVIDADINITYGYISSENFLDGDLNNVFDTLYKKNMDMLSHKI